MGGAEAFLEGIIDRFNKIENSLTMTLEVVEFVKKCLYKFNILLQKYNF